MAFITSVQSVSLPSGLTPLGSSNQILGVNNAGTSLEYKTFAGTANQITVTQAANLVTWSFPQDPSFTDTSTSGHHNTLLLNAFTNSDGVVLAFNDNSGTLSALLCGGGVFEFATKSGVNSATSIYAIASSSSWKLFGSSNSLLWNTDGGGSIGTSISAGRPDTGFFKSKTLNGSSAIMPTANMSGSVQAGDGTFASFVGGGGIGGASPSNLGNQFDAVMGFLDNTTVAAHTFFYGFAYDQGLDQLFLAKQDAIAAAASTNYMIFKMQDTGYLALNRVGMGFRVKEGSNAKQGVATLSGGTVTVSNTSITASSRIFLTVQSLGTIAVPVAIAVTARTNGSDFTITSSNVTDTSVVAWEIFEPS